jgi:hypothetical protein
LASDAAASADGVDQVEQAADGECGEDAVGVRRGMHSGARSDGLVLCVGNQSSTLVQGGADEQSDGGRVVTFQVLSGKQGTTGAQYGEWRQRQDLERTTVEGDEVAVDERVACLDVGVDGDLQRRADAVVGVEADTVAMV